MKDQEVSSNVLRRALILTIALSGLLPLILGLLVWARVEGSSQSFALHSALEMVGGCMALGVGLFLWLRLRDETVGRHFLWVVAALIAMGVMDGVHGVVPFGLAWSWTRHVATLAGGLLFASVWVPVGPRLWAARRAFILTSMLLSALAAFLVCYYAADFPVPWTASGYTVWPKLVNALGGLGFLGGTCFFLRRFVQKGERDDRVFAGHTMLFGISGLLFSMSNVWGPEWWLWHGFRFVAYIIVVGAVYQTASRLNRELLARKESLEQQVKQRTRALSESEAEFRASFDRTSTPMIQADAATGRFLRVNRPFCQMLGFEQGELVGKAFLDFTHPEDRRSNREGFERLVRGQIATFEVEKRFVRKDGRVIWSHVTANLVSDADGHPLRAVAVMQDVTERRQAESRLQESEARLGAALRIARLGTFEWDLHADTMKLDERSRAIFGFPPDGTIDAQAIFQRVDRRDFERVMTESQTAIRDCTRLETEYRISLPEGLNRSVISMSDILPGPDGKAARAFGVFADITDRRQREQQLTEQARLLDLSYDGIVVRDAHSRITYWNRGAEEIYGYTKAEAFGRSVHELLETRFPEPMEEIQAKLEQDGRWSGELIHTRRDGRRIVVLSRWALDRNSQGLPAAVLETNNDITERKRLVEALQGSEARFRGLMEQAPFSIQLLRPDGRTTRVNRAWEKLWGLNLDRLEGYNILEDSQLQDKGILPLLRKAFGGEAVQLPEIAYDPEETLPNRTRREDAVRWVTAMAYPLKGQGGRVEEVVLVHEDITQRRRAETELRESHSLLRTAMDAGKLGAWDWNIRKNSMTWTERLYEFYGLPPGSFGGTAEDFMQLVHPEDQPAMQCAIERALVSKAPYQAEFRTVRPNREVRWLFTRAEVFTDSSGKPLHMIGITQDVTGRKQFEEALREREEQLRGTFENAAVGMALVKLDGSLIRFNDALCRITGYPREELLTKTVNDLTFPEDLAPDWSRAHGLLAGELNTYSLEKRYVRKGGSLLWVNLTVSLQRDGSGQPQNFISVVEDITERKRAEEALQDAQEELRRQNQSLEQIVMERTAKLREAMAELESYSYSIAHDMRAPLRGMQGFAKLLLEEYAHEVSPEAQEYLNRISKSAERLDRLIQDVLNYSRIVSGDLRLEAVDPAPLLEEIIESYPHLQKVEDHIIFGSLPPVMANRAALTQVFSNLLGNAVKFVAPGVQPVVKIRGETLGDKVRFWIEDNGIGIEPHARQRIFQLFQRLHRPELYEGTGLGLAIVRKSAERMGGAVGVESEPGQGSRFWIELPAVIGSGPVGSLRITEGSEVPHHGLHYSEGIESPP